MNNIAIIRQTEDDNKYLNPDSKLKRCDWDLIATLYCVDESPVTDELDSSATMYQVSESRRMFYIETANQQDYDKIQNGDYIIYKIGEIERYFKIYSSQIYNIFQDSCCDILIYGEEIQGRECRDLKLVCGELSWQD